MSLPFLAHLEFKMPEFHDIRWQLLSLFPFVGSPTTKAGSTTTSLTRHSTTSASSHTSTCSASWRPIACTAGDGSPSGSVSWLGAMAKASGALEHRAVGIACELRHAGEFQVRVMFKGGFLLDLSHYRERYRAGTHGGGDQMQTRTRRRISGTLQYLAGLSWFFGVLGYLHAKIHARRPGFAGSFGIGRLGSKLWSGLECTHWNTRNQVAIWSRHTDRIWSEHPNMYQYWSCRPSYGSPTGLNIVETQHFVIDVFLNSLHVDTPRYFSLWKLSAVFVAYFIVDVDQHIQHLWWCSPT